MPARAPALRFWVWLSHEEPLSVVGSGEVSCLVKNTAGTGLTIRSSRARFAASALAGYDLTIANAAQRPGLAQALCPITNMRRKVIQHFANMLPQRFLDLPEGFDLAILAEQKSGIVDFDFLNGTALIAGIPQPQLRTSASYREWLLREADAHGVPLEALQHASMNVAFEVSEIEVRESYGHVFRSATFKFECSSHLRTDEKSYVSSSSGTKAWGYGHYWEQLFGTGSGA